MATLVKDKKKKGLTDEALEQVQTFVRKLKKGEISPFKDKTERARKNLKKAGLIK